MKSLLQKHSTRARWALLAGALLVSTSYSGFGATAAVSVINFAFVPATTNINTGDQVTWTWPSGSNAHNTVSQTSGLWASAVMNGPATFSHTFASVGSFPYSCTVHGFTGSIVVAAAAPPNTPPTVAITNPVANAVFAAPASVVIRASASDPDAGGSVTNVQFLNGTTLLANVISAPFTTTATLAAGAYTVSAIASDNLGAKTTNSVAFTVVTPSPVSMSAPQRAASSLRFSYAADVGLSYLVQRSTDLVSTNWSTLSSGMATSNPVVFVDPNATSSPSFYRVGRLPNP